MRSRFLKASAILTLGTMLLFWVGRGATAKAGDWDRDGRTLEGTWVVTVTQQACPNGPAIAPAFKSLLTFNAGGTMTETTDNPMFFPALRGPGHGVWNHTGQHTYSADTEAFVTLNGAIAKIQKISQTIEIGDDPNQFTTTGASVQFFDPNSGTLLMSGCATATGQRFE
jgi:hypothetical protein